MTAWIVDGVVLGETIGRGATATVVRGHLAPHPTQPVPGTVAPTTTFTAGSDARDGSTAVVVKIAHGTAEARSAIVHEAAVLRRLGAHGVRGVPALVRVAEARRVRSSDGERELVPALILQPAGHRSLRDLRHAPAGSTTPLPTSSIAARPAPDAAAGNIGRSVFADVAGTLAEVHAAGVVHGDLSPANVTVRGTEAMIIDFDNASIDGDRHTSHLVGTPPFIAPEVLAGDPPREVADVFSLAVVMALTLVPGLTPPRPGTDLAAMLVDAGCAPALARALAAGAALDPASRPTAATFHQLLRDAGPALAGPTARTGSSVRRDVEPGTLAATEPGTLGATDPYADGDVRHEGDADVARPCIAESDRDSGLDPGVWHAVIDEEAVTLDFGPRPPRPDAAAPASRPRAVLIGSAVAAVVGVLLIAVGGLQLLGAVEGTAAHRDAASDATRPTAGTSPGSLPIPRRSDGDRDPRTSRCAEPPSADATGSRAPVTRLEADVDASGCPATIEWRADTAEATVQTTGERHRFQLGVAGDVLLVGDWDGDGHASPALYRPPTGEVFEFDRWASTDRPEPTVTGRLTGVPGGQASVRHVSGHDAVEIEPPHAEP